MPSYTHDKLTAKFSQNNIKLQAADTTTFRSVQAVMENANIPFHTFALPAERQLKVLLRAIPSYITITERREKAPNIHGLSPEHPRKQEYFQRSQSVLRNCRIL